MGRRDLRRPHGTSRAGSISKVSERSVREVLGPGSCGTPGRNPHVRDPGEAHDPSVGRRSPGTGIVRRDLFLRQSFHRWNGRHAPPENTARGARTVGIGCHPPEAAVGLGEPPGRSPPPSGGLTKTSALVTSSLPLLPSVLRHELDYSEYLSYVHSYVCAPQAQACTTPHPPALAPVLSGYPSLTFNLPQPEPTSEGERFPRT